jgi:hypothetical protein
VASIERSAELRDLGLVHEHVRRSPGQGDAAFMELFRRQAPHIVQGSSVSEILETAEEIA